jgi:phage terminase large subunit-like protein
MGKIFDPRTTEAESRRYYLNDIVSEQNSWIEIQQLRNKLTPVFPIPPKTMITLGFDGAVTQDATALMGCVVDTGEIFHIKIRERPDIPLKDKEGNEIKWEVDPVEFDAAVAVAFKTWKVVGFFADPPYWQTYVDKWDAEYGDRLLVEAGQSSAIKWWTKRDTQMSLALERFHEEIVNESGVVKIQENKTVVRHFLNARVWERPAGNVIGKESKKSPKKIDACMAATLAFEARAAYLHHGDKPKPSFVPRRVDKR